MKKIISLLLLATLLITMAACTAAPDNEQSQISAPDSATPNPQPEPEPEVPTGLVLEEVYQSILNAQEGQEALVMFPEGDPGLIGSYYPGIADVELLQQVIYFPPIPGYVSEVVLVEVADPADAETVAAIFQARIDKGASDVTYPEVAAYWTTCAQVQVAGSYVAMIALPEGYTIPENVFTIQS